MGRYHASRKDGFFSMPVEAFVRSFWSIVFETDEALRPAKPGETDLGR